MTHTKHSSVVVTEAARAERATRDLWHLDLAEDDPLELKRNGSTWVVCWCDSTYGSWRILGQGGIPARAWNDAERTCKRWLDRAGSR